MPQDHERQPYKNWPDRVELAKREGWELCNSPDDIAGAETQRPLGSSMLVFRLSQAHPDTGESIYVRFVQEPGSEHSDINEAIQRIGQDTDRQTELEAVQTQGQRGLYWKIVFDIEYRPEEGWMHKL